MIGDTVILRLYMFLSSYSPLFGILALRFTSPPLVLGSLALCAVGIWSTLLVLRWEETKSLSSYSFSEVTDQGADVGTYVAGYLLPFLAVAEPSPREVVSYLMFLGLLGLIYVRSNMIQVNPVFYALGYRTFAVRTEAGWHGHLIAARKPEEGVPRRSLRITMMFCWM